MNDQDLLALANNVARSTVAVIDALAQRGSFKGEEMGTIGHLRDQCIQLTQLVEMQHSNVFDAPATELQQLEEEQVGE